MHNHEQNAHINTIHITHSLIPFLANQNLTRCRRKRVLCRNEKMKNVDRNANDERKHKRTFRKREEEKKWDKNNRVREEEETVWLSTKPDLNKHSLFSMKKKSLLAFVLYSLICWKLHDVFLFFSSFTSIHFAFSTYSQFVRFLPCTRWTAVRSGKVNATNNKFHNAEYDTSRNRIEQKTARKY